MTRNARMALVALSLVPVAGRAKTADELVARLSDPKAAPAALDQLIAKKAEAVPALAGEALEGKDLEARGWAIAGLAEIGGADAVRALVRLTEDGKAPALVRTWAAAARVNLAKSLEELRDLAPLAEAFPAVKRPLTLKVTALASSTKAGAESLLALARGGGPLQQVLAEPILGLGVDPLMEVMTRSKDPDLRQQAAAYLGSLAQRQGKAGNEIVGDAVAKAWRFDPKAKDVPWAGGPLYVPNIGWDRPFAMKLTRNLVAWHVWCGERGRKDEQKKIHHNLNSWSLASVLGYSMPGWGAEDADWLSVWGAVAGKKEVKALLEEQGLANDPKYQRILERL